jgi:dienelactone hydrolase
MSVYMASELVQERLGKDVPTPAAFAPLYPVCSNIVQRVRNPENPFYNTHLRMRAVPMLIQVGTRDDYEEGERPCDPLIALWPAAAQERATVRYVEGATHLFDMQRPATQFYDEFAHAGRGGMVSAVPSPEAAAEARQAVVSFFVKYLNP